MNSAQLAPAVIFPLIVWRVYVRARRNVGKQPLHRKRLKIRIGVFAALTLLFAAAAAMRPPTLLALLGGVAASAALAWLGVKLTRFERTATGDFYTPNTIIGVALSLLLIARLAYRFAVLFPLTGSEHMATQPSAFQSPLTMLILGLTFGYYVAYYSGVLYHARHLENVTVS